MVELRQAEDLAHRLEDYLRVLRKGEATLSAEGMDALFDGAQMLEEVIGVRRSGGTFPRSVRSPSSIARLVDAAARRGQPRAAGPPRRPTAVDRGRQWRCTFTPSADLVARGIRVDTVRERLAGAGEILDAVPRVPADGSIVFDFVAGGPARRGDDRGMARRRDRGRAHPG